MIASWLAAATQTRAREPNVLPQDFMLDARPAATLPFNWVWDWPIVS